MKIRASVIVPTYYRFETFKRCILSLFNQSFDSRTYEIFAVHDGENHGYDMGLISRWEREHPNFRFTSISRVGASEARNYCMKQCSGEYVLMIDDDCVASETWIETLISYMENHPELVATGGQVLSVQPKTFVQEYIKFKNLLRRPVRNTKGEVVTLITANVCYRSSVLKKINGFSRYFQDCGVMIGGEDLDLAFRAKHLGDLGYCEDAIVHHHHRSSLIALVKQHFMYGRGVYIACRYNGIAYSDLRFAKPTWYNLLRHMFLSAGRLVTISIPEYRKKKLPFWRYIPYFGLDLIRRNTFMLGAVYEYYRQGGDKGAISHTAQ